MSELQPCTHCKRHVRADDDTCPFCAAPIAARMLRPAFPSGRFTRAAVFAGALGAIGACTKDSKPSEAEPVPATTSDAAAAAPPAVADAAVPDAKVADASTPDAAPPDAAPKKKKRRKRAKPDAAVKSRKVRDRNMMPKPYGAPPARRRLV